MLQPTRTKYRKAHKGRIHGKASRANIMNYGSYGLKALQPERVISKQIEAARVALTRFMKRQGRVWTRIFPNIPVSKKPVEVRMGKGKGSPEYYACRVKPSYLGHFWRYPNFVFTQAWRVLITTPFHKKV